MFKSILGIKNKHLQYMHKHINFFEQLCIKIPEEIIQSAFYKYYIVKEPIGSEIIPILNSSAMIFEGKFLEEDY